MDEQAKWVEHSVLVANLELDEISMPSVTKEKSRRSFATEKDVEKDVMDALSPYRDDISLTRFVPTQRL
jgi:hypothetical protein